MYVSYLLLCCLVVCLARGQEDGTNSSDDKDSFINLNTNRKVDIEKLCQKVPCLVKCCPVGQILLTDENGALSCIGNSKEIYAVESPNDYSESVEIYNKDIKKNIVKTKKNVMNFTLLFNEKLRNNTGDLLNVLAFFPEPAMTTYLTEDGRIVVMGFNYVNNLKAEVPTREFCFENTIILDENGIIEPSRPQFGLYLTDLKPESSSDASDPAMARAKVSAWVMLVSCCFMVLVLVVYVLLKELRNLAGMMLMAYVATLTLAFVIRAIQLFIDLDTTACIIIGLLFLYTTVSSFTWMNVMSYDIWWSMRGFRKSRRIHKRGIPVKFAWYCLYAWGAPLVLILFIVIVEHLDLRHLPNFVKPHIVVNPDQCFLPDNERQLYLNGPIAITCFVNIVMFLMTAYNIWRIKSGVAQSAESKRNNKDETRYTIRFGIYLKLSMVMGISWMLEVLSSLVEPLSPWWYITDIYNTLVGVFIFYIFVCKKKIYKLLRKRFQSDNESDKRWDQGAYYTKTSSSRYGKTNAQDSETENSYTGETTDQLNSVKYI